jgi:hypothetical protein
VLGPVSGDGQSALLLNALTGTFSADSVSGLARLLVNSTTFTTTSLGVSAAEVELVTGSIGLASGQNLTASRCKASGITSLLVGDGSLACGALDLFAGSLTLAATGRPLSLGAVIDRTSSSMLFVSSIIATFNTLSITNMTLNELQLQRVSVSSTGPVQIPTTSLFGGVRWSLAGGSFETTTLNLGARSFAWTSSGGANVTVTNLNGGSVGTLTLTASASMTFLLGSTYNFFDTLNVTAANPATVVSFSFGAGVATAPNVPLAMTIIGPGSVVKTGARMNDLLSLTLLSNASFTANQSLEVSGLCFVAGGGISTVRLTRASKFACTQTVIDPNTQLLAWLDDGPYVPGPVTGGTASSLVFRTASATPASIFGFASPDSVTGLALLQVVNSGAGALRWIPPTAPIVASTVRIEGNVQVNTRSLSLTNTALQFGGAAAQLYSVTAGLSIKSLGPCIVLVPGSDHLLGVTGFALSPSSFRPPPPPLLRQLLSNCECSNGETSCAGVQLLTGSRVSVTLGTGFASLGAVSGKRGVICFASHKDTE